MKQDLKAFLKERPALALVGASDDPKKYGNIILKNLTDKKFKIFPINPRLKEIEGIPAFPDLKSARNAGGIDMVVYVVPPKVTRKSLEEAASLNLKRVWIQEGAGDEECKAFMDEHKFEYVMDGSCVMVVTMGMKR